MIFANKNFNLEKIPADMPAFMLLASDVFAPSLLLDWAKKLRLSGGDPASAREIEDHAQLMLEYQKSKGAKVPDMPKEEGKYWIIKRVDGCYVENDINEELIQKMESSSFAESIFIELGSKIIIDESLIKISRLEEFNCNGIFKMTNNNPKLLPTLTITKIF